MRTRAGRICGRFAGRTGSSAPRVRIPRARGYRVVGSSSAGLAEGRLRSPQARCFMARAWGSGSGFSPSSSWGVTRRASRRFSSDTELGSYQTAWALLHKVRSALVEGAGFLLTGDVEVDETYVGAREKGLRGGRARGRKAIVTAAIENRGRAAGALRLSRIDDVSGEQLGSFVEGVVDPSRSTVYTDAWQGYAGLPRRGFHHRSETQGRPERAAELLPWAHTIFSNLKTWLRGTYHGVSKKHLDSYLQEFVYRFNRRGFEQALFEHVIRAAATASPLTYEQLTAEPIG